jgi:hypothetical protein
MNDLRFRSFVDELMKIGSTLGETATGAWNLLKAHKKPLGYMAAGGAAVLGGKRLVENQVMAEQMRKQMRG